MLGTQSVENIADTSHVSNPYTAYKKNKTVKGDYRWVAGDSTDTVGDVGQQIGDRPAEVVVPRGLTLLLIEVM